jgi:hypothetical protein
LEQTPNRALIGRIATIAFGTALALSSNAVWHLFALKQTALKSETQAQFVGSEVLASEMASRSAGTQALAGLAAMAAIVLGVLAVAGSANAVILNLVALLALGSTQTGTTLSTTVYSFIKLLAYQMAGRLRRRDAR